MKDRDCKLDVMFPEGEEKCVTLTGMLSIQNEKYQVPFRETNRSCLTETPWLTELGMTPLTRCINNLSFMKTVILVVQHLRG